MYPFTAYEFVLMGRYPYFSPFSPPKQEDHQAVEAAISITDTVDFAHRYLSTLSGGERQKVFIAAALAQGAKIVILDEPTTYLDPKHQEDVHRLLMRINREEEITIITATHDINNALLASHRILALKKGSINFLGSVEELIDNNVLPQIYDKSFIFLRHPHTGQSIVF